MWYNKRVLKESDVHLFGMAAIFLATKQEDISHISLDDIVEKVGHNKFNEYSNKIFFLKVPSLLICFWFSWRKIIREAEFEILKTLDLRTDSPTGFTYLCRYLYKIFSCNNNSTIYDLT